MPVVVEFQQRYPDVSVKLLLSERIFRLEYGEAHVAIRAGLKPTEPDNVAQKFRRFQLALYASKDYVERYGKPEGLSDFANHRFVAREDVPSRALFFEWQQQNIPKSTIVFRASDDLVTQTAVKSGIGIGFIEVGIGDDDPDLVQMWAPEPEWDVQLWLVTHVDLHRTPKVQAILKALKDGAASGLI